MMIVLVSLESVVRDPSLRDHHTLLLLLLLLFPLHSSDLLSIDVIMYFGHHSNLQTSQWE